MSDGLLNRTFQSACVPSMLLVHAMDPCPRPSVRLGRSPCAPIAGGDSSWEASAARSAAASVAVAADMSSLSSCSPRCASSRASAIRRGAKTGSDGVWAEGGERMRALPSREDTTHTAHCDVQTLAVQTPAAARSSADALRTWQMRQLQSTCVATVHCHRATDATV